MRREDVEIASRVLDVGCGGGGYLRFLRERGYDVAGTEVDADLAARLQRESGIEISVGRKKTEVSKTSIFSLC